MIIVVVQLVSINTIYLQIIMPATLLFGCNIYEILTFDI